MINGIILSGAFLGIVLIVYLLIKEKIGRISFTTLFISILLFSLALYGFDRLKELHFGDLGIVLEEAKTARDDSYDARDEIRAIKKEMLAINEGVKDIAAATAEMAILSFGEEDFFGPLDSTDLNDKKDTIRERLKSAVDTLNAPGVDVNGLERIYHISK